MYSVSLTDDGKYLVIVVSYGWNRTDIFVRQESPETTDFVPVVQGKDALFYPEISGDTIYVHTNYGAPRYRVLALSLDQVIRPKGRDALSVPAVESWTEIIPESPDITLESMNVTAGYLVLHGLKDAVSHLYVVTKDGSRTKEIPLPDIGSISGISADTDSDEFLMAFESFTMAPVIMRVDAAGDSSPSVLLSSKQPQEPGDIQVKQVFYSSKDGTKIPMFILGKKGSAEGALPTILTGYGGFNVSRTPHYSPQIIPWLDAGGIYASANLRGGSEYGEEWHRAGMLDKKQNVFDDFIAAAEYLISQGYTDPHHLAIFGRSNGGLLVGAALTQRPDLFKAVVCGVPLLDMVRYHKFLIAHIWASEYGDPDDPEAFKWLYAYSPYHHLSEDVNYPATYFFTATSDSRVDPMHARKMAARLQALPRTTNPILIYIESDAGHGVGKPVHKVVAEQANIMAFCAWQLGLEIEA